MDMDDYDCAYVVPEDGLGELASLAKYKFVTDKTKKKIDELIEAEMQMLDGLWQYDMMLKDSSIAFRELADERLKTPSATNYFSLDRMLQSLVDSRLELMRYLKDAVGSYVNSDETKNKEQA